MVVLLASTLPWPALAPAPVDTVTSPLVPLFPASADSNRTVPLDEVLPAPARTTTSPPRPTSAAPARTSTRPPTSLTDSPWAEPPTMAVSPAVTPRPWFSVKLALEEVALPPTRLTVPPAVPTAVPRSPVSSLTDDVAPASKLRANRVRDGVTNGGGVGQVE